MPSLASEDTFVSQWRDLRGPLKVSSFPRAVFLNSFVSWLFLLQLAQHNPDRNSVIETVHARMLWTNLCDVKMCIVFNIFISSIWFLRYLICHPLYRCSKWCRGRHRSSRPTCQWCNVALSQNPSIDGIPNVGLHNLFHGIEQVLLLYRDVPDCSIRD